MSKTSDRQPIVEAVPVAGGNEQKGAKRLKTNCKTLFLKLKCYGPSKARADQITVDPAGFPRRLIIPVAPGVLITQRVADVVPRDWLISL